MKVFVHKIINGEIVHHGHWYDDDDDFYLSINYIIYSNEEYIIPEDIKNIIIKELTICSNNEWEQYKTYPDNTPKLYSLASNPKYMLSEEIDIPLSNKIQNIFKNNNIDVEICTEVPYEENNKYEYGVIGWNNMEYAKIFQPAKSICPTKIFNKRYNFCIEN